MPDAIGKAAGRIGRRCVAHAGIYAGGRGKNKDRCPPPGLACHESPVNPGQRGQGNSGFGAGAWTAAGSGGHRKRLPEQGNFSARGRPLASAASQGKGDSRMFRNDIRSFAVGAGRLIVLGALVWGAGVVWVTLGRDGYRGNNAGAEPMARIADNSGITGDPVARGRYLVMVGGCNDCHTPWIMTENGPWPDLSRRLSGHPQGMKQPPPPKASGR